MGSNDSFIIIYFKSLKLYITNIYIYIYKVCYTENYKQVCEHRWLRWMIQVLATVNFILTFFTLALVLFGFYYMRLRNAYSFVMLIIYLTICLGKLKTSSFNFLSFKLILLIKFR